MTNDLKNFLEGENKRTLMMIRTSAVEQSELGWLQEHNTCLLNFILDLVKKEVEKKTKKELCQDCYESSLQVEGWNNDIYHEEECEYNDAIKDISTIINNLRV